MKKLLHKIVTFLKRKGILRLPKSRHRQGFASGFTLIELLVSALIASVLVSIMLAFLVGVLESDRKETVKTNAQEELQAAISYISDDLQEAIYIYGAAGIAGINDKLPHTQITNPSSECNPTTNTCTPILVFWKRSTFNPDATARYSANATSEIIGCMPYGDTPASSLAQLTACRANSQANNRAFGRDSYTYSLVAYYLKNDTANPVNSGWSNTARILRWEIKDGYVAYCASPVPNGSSSITKNPATNAITSPAGCPAVANLSFRANSPLILLPIPLADPNVYFVLPSTGFNRPDFKTDGGLLSWQKFDNYDFSANPFVTLVDFMDDTDFNGTLQGGNAVATGTIPAATGVPRITIGRNDASNRNLDCDDPSVGVGTTDPVNNITQRVPADFANSDGSNPSRLSSFYACISPNTVTARIFMRGNAIARLTSPAIDRARRTPNVNNITFFPTADVRSFGRSQIGLGK